MRMGHGSLEEDDAGVTSGTESFSDLVAHVPDLGDGGGLQ